MNKRILGNSGFKISEIGLGTWQLGGDFGFLEEQTGLEILNKAVDRGINFFDTADVYGAGRSEEIIGRFLKESKPDIHVVTKYGRDGSVYPNNYTPESLRKSVEASIKRLGVEALDLLQLHCIPQKILEEGSVFNFLRDIKKEGLIKNFGASVETMEEAKICMKQDDLTSLQVIFNIFRQNPITEIFEEAKNSNIGIIVRLPLASGLLAGKYSADTTFEPQDHRNYNADGDSFSVGETFSGIQFKKGLDLVEDVRKFVPENISMAQFALRWILDHPAVSTIIAGATKIYQVESNAGTSSINPLDENIHNELANLYTTQVEKQIRGRY